MPSFLLMAISAASCLLVSRLRGVLGGRGAIEIVRPLAGHLALHLAHRLLVLGLGRLVGGHVVVVDGAGVGHAIRPRTPPPPS